MVISYLLFILRYLNTYCLFLYIPIFSIKFSISTQRNNIYCKFISYFPCFLIIYWFVRLS